MKEILMANIRKKDASKNTVAYSGQSITISLKVYNLIRTFMPYFSVTTLQVKERVCKSLVPVIFIKKGSFSKVIEDNPDLYGPV
jgi:hypothetical protein